LIQQIFYLFVVDRFLDLMKLWRNVLGKGN